MASTKSGRRGRSDHDGDGVLAAVRSEIPGMRDELRSLAHDTGVHGKRLAGMARSVAVNSGTRAADLARQRAALAAERARTEITNHPLTSVLIAAGVGAVLVGAFMMMTSRRRHRSEA